MDQQQENSAMDHGDIDGESPSQVGEHPAVVGDGQDGVSGQENVIPPADAASPTETESKTEPDFDPAAQTTTNEDTPSESVSEAGELVTAEEASDVDDSRAEETNTQSPPAAEQHVAPTSKPTPEQQAHEIAPLPAQTGLQDSVAPVPSSREAPAAPAATVGTAPAPEKRAVPSLPGGARPPLPGGRPKSVRKFNLGGGEKCCKCEKTVYASEKLEVLDAIWHKACFRCTHCNGVLSLSNFAADKGTPYCKTHYVELFKTRGSFDFDAARATRASEGGAAGDGDSSENGGGSQSEDAAAVVAAARPRSMSTKVAVEQLREREEAARREKEEAEALRRKAAEAPQRARTMSFGGGEKCAVCEKPVYASERVSLGDNALHRECFRCSHCKKQLTMESYTSHDKVLYCRPHYIELFKASGSLDLQAGAAKTTAPDASAHSAGGVAAPVAERSPTTTSSDECSTRSDSANGDSMPSTRDDAVSVVQGRRSTLESARRFMETAQQAAVGSEVERKPAGSRGSVSFKGKLGGGDKCSECGKTVYMSEKVEVLDKILHKTCFRCTHCNCVLQPTSFAAQNGTPYCKTHYVALFRERGSFNFSENASQNEPDATKASANAESGAKDVQAAPQSSPVGSVAAQAEAAPSTADAKAAPAEPAAADRRPGSTRLNRAMFENAANPPSSGSPRPPLPGGRPKSVRKFNLGGGEKCCKCEKTVYASEKLEVLDAIWHKACFRCTHCNGVLSLSNFAADKGTPYCKTHYVELFKTRGSFDFDAARATRASEGGAAGDGDSSENGGGSQSEDAAAVVAAARPRSMSTKVAVEQLREREEAARREKEEAEALRRKAAEAPQRARTMSFGGGEKCAVCEKPVYASERVSLGDNALHRECFRCSHCKKQLTMESYTSHDKVLYCRPHYIELFKASGSLDLQAGAAKTAAHMNSPAGSARADANGAEDAAAAVEAARRAARETEEQQAGEADEEALAQGKVFNEAQAMRIMREHGAGSPQVDMASAESDSVVAQATAESPE